MILYHGTNMAFDVIDLKKSKPNKDFGRGFYLSADYDQALAMAKVKVDQLEEGEPIVLAFEDHRKCNARPSVSSVSSVDFLVNGFH